MNIAAKKALHITRKIVDFALPPRCPGCGIVTEAAHLFCFTCWQTMVFLGEPCCERCGFPFDYDGGKGVECGKCLASPPAFDRLRAAVAYGEMARKVALKIKYSGRPGVADILGHFMQRHIMNCDPDSILTPVPLHRWRIWARGYNQSALIAANLARRTGLVAELDLIERIKATPPLKGMGRQARAQAVRGAFHISGKAKTRVAGRKIILVDDVFTTGATANACAKLLKRSGAARVDVLCWARVVNEKDV